MYGSSRFGAEKVSPHPPPEVSAKLAAQRSGIGILSSASVADESGDDGLAAGSQLSPAKAAGWIQNAGRGKGRAAPNGRTPGQAV